MAYKEEKGRFTFSINSQKISIMKPLLRNPFSSSSICYKKFPTIVCENSLELNRKSGLYYEQTSQMMSKQHIGISALWRNIKIL